MNSLRRIYTYANDLQADIRAASLFSVGKQIFDILPEVIHGVLVDTVVQRESSWLAQIGILDVWKQILLLGFLTAVTWILESSCQYLYQLRWRNLAQEMQHRLRLDVYARFQRLPFASLQKKRLGETLSVLNEDIHQLERFLNGGINDIIQVIVSSVAVSGVFFYLSPKIALIAVLPIPLIVFGAFTFQKKLGPKYDAVRVSAANLSALIANNIAGIGTIRAYAQEEAERNRVEEKSRAYISSNRNAIAISSAITPVIRMGVLAGFLGTLLYGGYLTLHDELAVGAFSVLVFLTQRLLWPLTRLADMTDLYQRSMASARRAFDLLEEDRGNLQETHGAHLEIKDGHLSFRNVSLRLENNTILRDVSFDIEGGQTVAFVGSTGSGKTSLARVLLKFYGLDEGAIFIDGQNIALASAESLRKQIAFVSQTPFLMDGTVLDNIRYGASEADGIGAGPMDLDAADMAQAHSFIEGLDAGYDTSIGEAGRALSGGQKQRIALARGFRKNAPILILDEATSAIDNETELRVRNALEKQAQTTIVIAHRLTTVRFADRIFVLDDGRIAESGQHDELIAAGGRYRRLWDIQAGNAA